MGWHRKQVRTLPRPLVRWCAWACALLAAATSAHADVDTSTGLGDNTLTNSGCRELVLASAYMHEEDEPPPLELQQLVNHCEREGLAIIIGADSNAHHPLWGMKTSNSRVVEEPEFTDVIQNMTVPAGRSVRLACSVKNLGSYKVAWMHFEQSAILTVHNHVITRNPRVSVTHDKHRTWFLHISDVREEDRGRYMCQINTVTAKTQFGYLHVVVPPTIDDSLSSSDVIVREGANVTLTCRANGSPKPTIKWKRDDNSKISITKGHSVSDWEGEVLEMARISRLDMGAYLCIASNGVPPTVSKRVKVSVDFPPMLWIPHQLVGAPLYYNVTLECFTEAHPTSLNYWTRDDGHMIHESSKYHMENTLGAPAYKTHMRLLIRHITNEDYGTYKCVAKNPRGESDGTIRLYTSSPPTTTPDPRAVTVPPPSKPPRKDTPVVDKGTKYQSNLNEIEKGKQKPDEGGGKSHLNWVGGASQVTGYADWRRSQSWILILLVVLPYI